MSRGGRWLAGSALALLLACCSPTARPARSTPRSADGHALRYHVQLDAGMTSMDVELCFERALSDTLIPGRAEAGYRLRSAHWLSPGARKKLRSAGGRIVLPRGVRSGCLGYSVSLAEGGSLHALVRRVGDNLIASPNAWLWRPYRRPRQLRAQLRASLPSGHVASLPWPRQGDDYLLDASAFAFDSHAAFGALQEARVEAHGVEARAALLAALPRLPRAALERWLREALFTATLSDGQFPARGLHLLVVPVPRARESFGSVARGGGASVLMLVPADSQLAELRQDWVLPHELSHLLLPFVTREDAWLAEGLATYYQELLRARAGLISAQRALLNMAWALRDAERQGSGRTLCQESRAMHQTASYRRVYWGGAGHWLNVDVLLRQRPNGPTLDGLLRSLRQEARSTPPYSAQELLERLDQLSGTQLFSALLASCQSQPFPSFEPSLQALGVAVDGSLVESEPAQALRAALFAPQPVK